MDTTQALDILRKLASGASPYTGKVFGPDSVLQKPDTVRALVAAIHALERLSRQQRNLPVKTGSFWSETEEQKIVEAYVSGKSIEQIAKEHQRTEGGIHARLVRLNVIEE